MAATGPFARQEKALFWGVRDLRTAPAQVNAARPWGEVAEPGLTPVSQGLAAGVCIRDATGDRLHCLSITGAGWRSIEG